MSDHTGAAGSKIEKRELKQTPTYSIIIPVYNRVFGFREALESSLAVRGCTEILVLDDHSNHDQFQEIATSYPDQRIVYQRNDATLGLFGNWNRGVSLATGDFVSILCSDDLIAPTCFDEFLFGYFLDSTIDVFFGSFCTFTKDLTRIKVFKQFPAGKIDSVNFLRDALEHGLGFPVLTITKRSTLLKYPFVSSPHSGNDWLWIYGNASKFNMYATDRPISYWRRHPDQDAAKSISVTNDCWPYMFQLMYEQLMKARPRLANMAVRKAKSVILSWLLNDFKSRSNYFPRLSGTGAKDHIFLAAANQLIETDWLLSRLMKAESSSKFYRTIGRIVRKLGYYPPVLINKGTIIQQSPGAVQ